MGNVEKGMVILRVKYSAKGPGFFSFIISLCTDVALFFFSFFLKTLPRKKNK